MDMGLALWLILNFIFCILYFWNFGFVFLKFWVRIFLYFVFLRNCIRIYCVFILYLFSNHFVFLQKIQNKYKQIHFVCLYLFLYFSITSKNALCIFVFFFVFFHSFTDCTLSLCICRSLDMPSKNKTANPPMHGCIFLYFGFVFCILMITGSTVCSQRLTTQHLYVFDCFCFMLRRVLIIPI
jgi:hypothetical protein